MNNERSLTIESDIDRRGVCQGIKDVDLDLWTGESSTVMLLQFPTDIFLYIISFAPVHDLCSLQLVSRQLFHLICDHEDSIYHQAAVLHKFAPPEVSLENVKCTEARRCTWVADVQTWKELCEYVEDERKLYI